MKTVMSSGRVGTMAMLAIAAGAVAVLGGMGTGSWAPRTLYGPAAAIGSGTGQTFVELAADGEPVALGITMTEAALQGLPTRMNTTSRCFDKDGNGHATHGECLGDYQSVLSLPSEAAGMGLPVTWATVNWNPEGHQEPAPPVWSAAHFDFHFYMEDQSTIEGIRPGPCGEFIHCDDFETASEPLPAGFQPVDYIDVGAAVPGMGNHLVDAKDPELLDPSLGFTSTFIYGAYAGRLIFLEPMVSRAYLETRPDECRPLKAPEAWEEPGYYPTRYCVRFVPISGTYRITLEGLVRHSVQ